MLANFRRLIDLKRSMHQKLLKSKQICDIFPDSLLQFDINGILWRGKCNEHLASIGDKCVIDRFPAMRGLKKIERAV